MRIFGIEIRRSGPSKDVKIESDVQDQDNLCQDCPFDADEYAVLKKTVQRIERKVYRNKEQFDFAGEQDDNAWLRGIK